MELIVTLDVVLIGPLIGTLTKWSVTMVTLHFHLIRGYTARRSYDLTRRDHVWETREPR